MYTTSTCMCIIKILNLYLIVFILFYPFFLGLVKIIIKYSQNVYQY